MPVREVPYQMKNPRIAHALLLAAAAALAGCAPKAVAPRIPAFRGGPGAPFGEEAVLPEPPPPPLREAPEGIPREFVK